MARIRERIAGTLLLLPLTAFGATFLLERCSYSNEVAERGLRPAAFQRSYRAHEGSGLLAAHADPSTLQSEAALTLLAHESMIASDARDRQDDEDWLRRKLGEVGVVSVDVAIRTLPGSTLAQRVHALRCIEGATVCFLISAEDLWLDSYPTRTARLRHGSDGEGSAVMPADATPLAPRVETLPAWLVWLRAHTPLWRLQVDRIATLPQSSGFFPDWLAPWRREGAADEATRYYGLEAALHALAVRARDERWRVLIARLPLAFEVHNQGLVDLLVELGLDLSDVESRRFERRTRDAVTKHGLAYLDLRPPLAKVEAGLTDTLHPIDHYPLSQRDRQLVLAAIASEVRRLFD